MHCFYEYCITVFTCCVSYPEPAVGRDINCMKQTNQLYPILSNLVEAPQCFIKNLYGNLHGLLFKLGLLL